MSCKESYVSVMFHKSALNIKRECTLFSHFQFSSVQFSRSVMSNSLRPHESQHTRPPCPSPTPGVHSNSRPSSQWCHPPISSSVAPFSSCPQSLPASESFPMSTAWLKKKITKNQNKQKSLSKPVREANFLNLLTSSTHSFKNLQLTPCSMMKGWAVFP